MSIKQHNHNLIIVSVFTLYNIAFEKLILIFTLLSNFLLSPERAKIICLYTTRFGFFRNLAVADIGSGMEFLKFNFSHSTRNGSIYKTMISHSTRNGSIRLIDFSHSTRNGSIRLINFSHSTRNGWLCNSISSHSTRNEESKRSKTPYCEQTLYILKTKTNN